MLLSTNTPAMSFIDIWIFLDIWSFSHTFPQSLKSILRNHTVLVSESNKKIILNFARRVVNEWKILSFRVSYVIGYIFRLYLYKLINIHWTGFIFIFFHNFLLHFQLGGGKNPSDYNPASGRFQINGNTNLHKYTGGSPSC